MACFSVQCCIEGCMSREFSKGLSKANVLPINAKKIKFKKEIYI